MTFEAFRRRTHRWTPADERKVLEKEKPDAALASEIGVTARAVRVRRAQLKKAGKA